MGQRIALEEKPEAEWTDEDWELFLTPEEDEISEGQAAAPIEESHGTTVTVAAPTRVKFVKKNRHPQGRRPGNGNGGNYPTSDLLVRDDDKSFVKYDRLEARAEAEGRIDGPHKCLTCGSRYLYREEARDCCRIF